MAEPQKGLQLACRKSGDSVWIGRPGCLVEITGLCGALSISEPGNELTSFPCWSLLGNACCTSGDSVWTGRPG